MESFQIVPMSKGAYPGIPGAFTVVDLDQHDNAALVYVESWAGNLFLFGPDEIWRGRVAYDYMRQVALDQDASIRLLDRTIRELS